jgi:hypothetical protein
VEHIIREVKELAQLSHARSTVRMGFQDTVTNERTGGESFRAVGVLLSILDEDTCFGAFVQIRQLGLGGGDFNKTFASLARLNRGTQPASRKRSHV